MHNFHNDLHPGNTERQPCEASGLAVLLGLRARTPMLSVMTLFLTSMPWHVQLSYIFKVEINPKFEC